jgi:hypothetical protein
MTNIQSISKKTIVCAAVVLLSATVQAANIPLLSVITNEASFLQITGAVQSENFNTYTSDQPANNLNFGAFTAHNSISVDAPSLTYSVDGTANVYVDTSYGGWADLRFNAPVVAFGAWFAGLSSFSTMKVAADSLAGYGSYSHVGTYQPTATIGNTPQFIGFTSSQAFNRIVFEGVGCCHSGFAIDNVVYATTLAPVPAPVPEPETYAMLLAGLGLMGAVARRRSTRTSL